MERLLEKIIQCKENGLYFVNTPTGSAKSYSAVQLMKNHYQGFDSHFIFITNNLNNLPMEDLEKAFGNDFKNQVIRVESIVDNIVHHFDESIIPDEYKKLNSYKELYDCLNNYKYLARYIQNELAKGKTPNIGVLKYFDQSKEDLANKDSSFCKDIRKHLMKSGFAELNFEERKAIVKSKYKWLTTLYPAMFIEDYKVICMSVKRFFTYIDPIYMKNYRFIPIEFGTKQERSQNGRMSGHILSFYRMDDKVKALILHEDCHIIRKQKEKEVCEGDIFTYAGTNIEILQIKR